MEKKTDKDIIPEIDKGTCWYTNECAAEMNKAFDAQRKDMPVVPHIEVLKKNIACIKPMAKTVLDIGCGTASSSPLFEGFDYTGMDMPHILEYAAKRNFPEHKYISGDIMADDLSYISQYDIILMNGFIDVMEHPLIVFNNVLAHAKDYVILHRQEITKNGPNNVVRRGSYNSTTFHSIISRSDFENTIKKNGFVITQELNCDFGNWEDGGHSFLLRKAKSYALNNMDLQLDEIFGGKTNGIFIEAGANSGTDQSNTAYFEFFKNWRGLLVEPVLSEFEKCKAIRPDSICENYALVANDSTSSVTMNHYEGNHGLLTMVDNEYSRKIAEIIKQERPINITVPAISLNTLLEKHLTGSTIDLFSLDVEGYEEEVLRGVNFDKWNIKWLLIEKLEHSEFNPAIYLDKWYVLHSALSSHDYLFRRK